MRRPEWIDVVLEGKGLELERALADARTLGRWLLSDWRWRAAAVAELSGGLAQRGERTEEALEAARRRLRQDPTLHELARLIQEVERELEALRAALERAGTGNGEGGLWALVSRLTERARDEAVLATAHRQYRVERVALAAIAGWALAVPPVLSWFVASNAGAVKTVLDLNGLVEDGVTQLVSALALAGLVAVHLRARWWRWLDVPVPATRWLALAGACGAALGLLASHSPLVAAVTGTLAALTAEWVELVRPVSIARRST